MSTSLDMSLDDIIKNNKKTHSGGGGSRGRGRGRSGPGPSRRAPSRSGNRPAPYSTGKAADYGVYSNQVAAFAAFAAAAARPASVETGTKLYISNLEYGVSNEDIKELFSEVGDLKRYSVHYDRSGRSKGTAEVVFARKEHALAAVKRYNNVQLDGKPMKIEVVGTNIEKPAILPPVANGFFGKPNGIPKSGRGRGGFMGPPRGGGRGQRGGRGRGRGRSDPISAADLDADLDKYHSEAMQIN
ncbi:THO complex subunit 4B-like [Iris pallida]|uniref:THO complex subunit 4B-like n=1 Tax=Iris pallida TaxID=29817 RepID=A0AAX6DWK3_IRIPA|nr:THO complex subunit 4B-like [Iris pallida]KAJ6831164.1 THO complex subunit 4B-like [Iris pallida]